MVMGVDACTTLNSFYHEVLNWHSVRSAMFMELPGSDFQHPQPDGVEKELGCV